MIDRLSQIKNLAVGNEISSDGGLNNGEEVEDYVKNEGIDDEFFEDIKSVREMIVALNKNNITIQNLKGKYAKAIKATQEKNSSDQMNEIINQNSSLHKQIKDKLKSIEEKVKLAKEIEPDEPETKMKENFYFSLSKQIKDVVQKQQTFQDQYKNTVKDKVFRQVRLIDRDIDEEKAQEFVDNPALAQEMLERKIYGQPSITLQNTVSDIQDKFRDIKKLQTSVMQCMELFNELSALVFAQGEKIDNIEANVATSKDYVQKAEKKLKKAKQHHKWSKKCMCISIIIGLVILIIVVIIVVATSNKK